MKTQIKEYNERRVGKKIQMASLMAALLNAIKQLARSMTKTQKKFNKKRAGQEKLKHDLKGQNNSWERKHSRYFFYILGFVTTDTSMMLPSTLWDKTENICLSLTVWIANYQRGILTVGKAWLIKQTTLYTRSHRHVNTHTTLITCTNKTVIESICRVAFTNTRPGLMRWTVTLCYFTDFYVKYFIHLVNITCQYMRTFSQQQTFTLGKK